MAVVEAATVWMVHARTPLDGIRGTLSVEDGVLRFRPAGGRSADTEIPARNIRRVRRARGSPVLEVSLDLPGAPKIIGFYFVRPPSLAPPTEGIRLFSRYLARRRGIAHLRAGNAARGHDVDVWVEALRATQQDPAGED